MMGTMALSPCPLSVWWDMRTCPYRLHMDPSLLASRMQSVFLDHGLSPAINAFSAYADASHLPFSLQKALVNAGIQIHHSPLGKTNIKDFAMVVDMLIWVLEHPAPANIVVITSNTELAHPLHKLRMKCYNIILITPQLDLKSSLVLTKAATLVLTWPSLHILPEAMKHQVLSRKYYSTPFVDYSLMTKIGNTSTTTNNNAPRKIPEQDTTEPSDMVNLKQRRICNDDSLKRPDLDSLCMPPPSNACLEKKVEKQGMISGKLVELKKVEAWLQSLMESKAAAHGIPVSSLPDLFTYETGATHTLREALGNKRLVSGLLKFQHVIELKCCGRKKCIFPVISQSSDMDIQEASQAEKVEEEGTIHTPLIESSETGKAEKAEKIVESLKQLADNSPRRAALGSPYMPPPPTNANQKEKAEQQGSKESPVITKFELWLQSLMQTKKAVDGIPISCLGNMFKHESGITQKLRKLLGEGTLVAGLLIFPHIIRLEQCDNEVFAFPVISQKDNVKASQAEKVNEEGTAHISPIEPSETGKAKKRRIGESLEQFVGNSPKRAALGSPCMSSPPTKISQKKKAKQKGTKESLVLAKIEPWLQNLMQTKKAAKGIQISCLKDWFKHESGSTQKLRKLLGEGTRSAGLLKFPHIIRLEQHINEVFAFPVISQKDNAKASRADKVKEKGTIRIPQIDEPSETRKAKKGRIAESTKQLADNSPKRAAPGSPYMPSPPPKTSQKKKSKQQGIKESLVLAEFELWLENLMQTKKATKGILISCLKDWFKHESGTTQKLRKLLGEGTLSAGLLKFPHIIRLEQHDNEVFAFPTISQKDNTKARRAKKVKEEGTVHISLIESSETRKAKKRRIVESLEHLAGNSQKRATPGSLYMLPPSPTKASQKKKAKQQGTKESLILVKFERWLQNLMQTKKASKGIPISCLKDWFKHESGITQKLQKLLGEGTLSSGLLKFPHIIRLEQQSNEVFAFPTISHKDKMKASQAKKVKEEGTVHISLIEPSETRKAKKRRIVESLEQLVGDSPKEAALGSPFMSPLPINAKERGTKKSLVLAKFEPWLQNLMQTKKASKGIPISCLKYWFKQESGMTQKLLKLLGEETLSAGLLKYPHIIRLEQHGNKVFVFPTISQKDNTKASRAKKVKEEGTVHISLIEPSETSNAKKRRIVESPEQLIGNSPKRAAPGSPYMLSPPPKTSQKKKAKQQGTKESLVLAKFEPWLQNLMQTKKASKGIPISCLKDWFKHESGMPQKLHKLLGEETLSAGLLKYPHIIRLEQHGNEVFVFPTISQKDNTKASQAKKVKEEGTVHISLIEPSGTRKAKKRRIVESLEQLVGDSPKEAALGSPFMSPLPINAKERGTKKSLVLAKFEPWLHNLMQTKKASKGIPISCLKYWFKQESGMTQKLLKLLGEETLSAGLLKYPHIIRLKQHGNKVFVSPTISQKDNSKASRAKKVKEEGTVHISLIEPSETSNAKKRRIVESPEQLIGNSPKRAAPGSPYMLSPPPKTSQKKKAKQQGTKESLVLAKFEPWLQNLMQTKKASKGIPISCLKDWFKHESGMPQKLRKILGEETLSAGLLKYPHIIRLEQHGNEVFVFPTISQKDNTTASQAKKVKEEGTVHISLIEPSETSNAKKRRIVESLEQLVGNSPKRAAPGSPYMPSPPPKTSQKKKAKQQGTKESLVLAKFEPWLQNLMQTKKASKGIPISCLKDWFKHDSGVTQKLQKLLGEGKLSAGLLKFPHIIRLEQHDNEVFAFPTISQKDKMKATQTEKVKEEVTAHIPLIEPNETGKAKKRRIVESLEQLVGDSPKGVALGSPHMPPSPTNASRKNKAREQGTKESLVLAKFELWLQNLMQTKKSSKGIPVSCLKDWFKHESGMTQKLRKLLGEGTLSAGLLKFPHIIRLEQHGNEAFAFPVISQKEKIKASHAGKVIEECAAHISLFEPSEAEKAEKRMVVESLGQLVGNSTKRAALGSPCMPSPLTRASQKRKAEQQGTKESLVLAEFEPWLQNLMQTKKSAKGIPISCLNDWFKQQSGVTQKLQKLLGEGTLSAGLLKFPHIIRLQHYGNEVFAFPVISQKDNIKAGQAEKVKEEDVTRIPLIEPSETRKAEKGRTAVSLKQLANNSSKRAALCSPYLPPTDSSQNKKAKKQETNGSQGSTKFEPWLRSLMQTKKAAGGIRISSLENLFKQESGMKQKLRKLLGKGTLSTGLLNFPHIIRLEHYGTEVFAFSVISPKGDMMASQAEKVEEEGEDNVNIPYRYY